MAVDADGTAYVAGWARLWSDGQPPLQQLFLCKYGRNGELLWRRLDPFPDAFVEWPVHIALLPGGRVAVGGTAFLRDQDIASPRIWVVDAAGADVWSAMPGIPRPSVTVTALVAASDGALLVGTDGPPGRVYKLSAAGALEWVRQSAKWDQWGVNALAGDPGGDVFVGYQAPYCLLHRLSPAGDTLWSRPVGDPDVPGHCAALGARAGGGIFASGTYLDSFDQGWRGFLAAYDADGQLVWERKLAAAAWGTSAINALAVGPSGRVAAAGYAYRGATDYDAVVQDVKDEPPASQSFYTVAPCRVFDTRDARLGGPAAIAVGAEVEVPLGGRCGLPTSARSVAVNVTAITPTAAGHVTAYPAGRVAPRTSLLNYRAGVTRASQATLVLGDGGRLTIRPVLATGSVHAIVDVAGYFE